MYTYTHIHINIKLEKTKKYGDQAWRNSIINYYLTEPEWLRVHSHPEIYRKTLFLNTLKIKQGRQKERKERIKETGHCLCDKWSIYPDLIVSVQNHYFTSFQISDPGLHALCGSHLRRKPLLEILRVKSVRLVAGSSINSRLPGCQHLTSRLCYMPFSANPESLFVL